MNGANKPNGQGGGDLDFLGSDFDLEQNKSTGGGAPIPAGEYDFNISSTEFKPTKDGAGKYLELELTVANGEHEGRKVWDRLNLVNASEKARSIAIETFSDACLSAGLSRPPADSAELRGRTLRANIKVRRSEEYGDSNDVRWYVQTGPKGTVSGSTPPPTQSFNDDDLPF